MSSDTSSAFQELLNDFAFAYNDASGDIQKYVITPAILEVLGPIQGKEILDLVCGAGYLARRFAALGAKVTAIDNSERLIEIAGEINLRENDGIKYIVADPSDLSMIDDSSFDDMVCNMGLMSIRDLSSVVAELARSIKLGGRFIFSVLHPCFCMPDACWARDIEGNPKYRIVDNYFADGGITMDEISSYKKGRIFFKHRTLSTYINALSSRGFQIRRMVEPRPSPTAIAAKPELAIYSRIPIAVIIEAVFPYF